MRILSIVHQDDAGPGVFAEAIQTAGHELDDANSPEISWHEVELTPEGASDPLLGPLPGRFEAFQWHSYEFPLPPGATPLARSPVCLQGYRLKGTSWGIQFHAEVSRASVESWLEGYAKDPDALGAGVDPEEIRAETRQRIEEWNALGRGVCSRFLGEAERHSRPD